MCRDVRVTHVVYTLDVGGLENGLVNIVNDEASGIRHAIICLKRVGALRGRLGRGVEVFELGKRPGHDVRAFVRLARLFRQLRSDIVHSRNWGTVDAVLAASQPHHSPARDSSCRMGGVRMVVFWLATARYARRQTAARRHAH